MGSPWATVGGPGNATAMPHSGRFHAGFTLVEALVALAVGTTLALATVPLLAAAAVAVRRAGEQTVTVALASAKLEQLLALDWMYVPVAGGGVIRWTDTSTDTSPERPTGGGRGLLPSPGDSLALGASGYVDYLDRHGRWAGTGPTPPADARFVRRWRIAPLPADPDDVVVVQVMASPLSVDLGAAARRPGVRLPGETWLTAIRARTAP